jgi:hypothetical protein
MSIFGGFHDQWEPRDPGLKAEKNGTGRSRTCHFFGSFYMQVVVKELAPLRSTRRHERPWIFFSLVRLRTII